MEEILYRQFYEVEKRHWWFVARHKIIRDVIDRRLKLRRHSMVLDVGCGTGAILENLCTDFDAYGIDNELLAIEFCRKRGIKNVLVGDLDAFNPARTQLDLVTLLDVVEHVENDLAVLQKVHSLLKPNAAVLVTVPAFQCLWSRHDDINHHKRRYLKSEIAGLLVQAGFSVRMVSYYNTFLFPAALIQRTMQRILGDMEDRTLNVPSEFLNNFFEFIFSSERFFLRRMSFPVGLSIIALGIKPNDRESHDVPG